MSVMPRIVGDVAGLAGNAVSAGAGAREERTALSRTRVDEILGAHELVRRDEFDAVQEMATRARIGQAETEARLAALESRLATLEGLTEEEKGGPQG